MSSAPEFLNGILIVFLFFFVASNASEVPNYREHYIEDLCRTNQTLLFFLDGSGPSSSLILHGARLGISYGGKNCTVVLRPPPYRGIVLSVTSLLFGNFSRQSRTCLDDYVQFFDGESSRKLCGTSFEENANSLIHPGEMQFLYHSTNIPKLRLAKLTFVATVYRNDYIFIPCSRDEFRCNRSICIWNGFACDGVNNCGDLRDENTNGKSKCDITTEGNWIIEPTVLSMNPDVRAQMPTLIAVCVVFLLLFCAFRFTICCNESTDKAALKLLRRIRNLGRPPLPPFSYLDDDDDPLLGAEQDLPKKVSLNIRNDPK